MWHKHIINTISQELVVCVHYYFCLNCVCESLQGKGLHLCGAISVLGKGEVTTGVMLPQTRDSAGNTEYMQKRIWMKPEQCAIKQE